MLLPSLGLKFGCIISFTRPLTGGGGGGGGQCTVTVDEQGVALFLQIVPRSLVYEAEGEFWSSKKIQLF